MGRASIASRSSKVSRRSSRSRYSSGSSAASKGDRQFRPTLNAKSVQILNEKGRRKDIHGALYDEQKLIENKKFQQQREKEEKFKNGQKQLVSNTVDKISDIALQNRFKEEFNEAFDEQINLGPELYLIDIVEDLRFIRHDQMSHQYKRIEQLLSVQRINLIIKIILEGKRTNLSDVKMNLLNVTLAM